MDKLPVGQLPDLQQSNNDDEIMVITNSEYNQLKKEKISDLITDFTSTNENNALTKGTDGKLFVTDFGNASNITEGTLPVSVLPDIPKDLLPAIETTDLPNSGVTADTYAYPSSVTVNAQGQVTAIEEGTPSGANADTDLSNLTDEGEKHFLNKTQVTNCILEEPDNTIYEYNDSSFTFKAGSIAIFPYGTSAPAKSIGDDLFNNGRWIITDIQYDSGKLFYWARKQNDLTLTSWSASALSGDSKVCYGQDNGIYSFLNTYSGTSIPEGAVTGMFYNTNDNRVYRIYNGSIEEYQSNYYSFPFMILHFDNSVVPKSVKQLFKGQGYIGATRWVNKGVKLLFPNGRNQDGTLNNIEVENTKLLRLNLNNSTAYTTDYEAYLTCSYNNSNGNTVLNIGYITADRYFETDNLDEIPQEERNAIVYRPSFNDFWWYNASEDKWYERTYCITGEMYYNYSSASKILEFKPRNTFRAVDYNDFYELQNNSANKDLTNLTNGLANVICTTAPTTTSTASSQNPAVVIENYVNGASGYRVCSDGYCEQWGSITNTGTINLLKSYVDTNYNIVLGTYTAGNLSGDQSGGWKNKTVSNFFLQYGACNGLDWKTCGYIS